MIEKTVGVSGADYTTWQAGFNANADAADDIRFTAITADDLGALDANVGNANSKRYICTAAEGVCFRSASAWPVTEDAIPQSARIGLVTSHMPNVEVYNLCCIGGINEDYAIIVGDCIISGSTGGYGIYHPSSFVTGTFYNIQMFGAFSGLYCGNGTDNIYHSSFWGDAGATFGIRAAGGTPNAYACIVGNHGFGAWDGGGGDYNVADDATAPGANSFQSQSGFFTDTTGGQIDLHLNAAKVGDYPVANYQGSVSALSLDIDDDARPTSNANAGSDEPAGGGNPPNATYAEDSQPCEGSNGTITPTNTGDAITSSAVASGTLPTGYVLNANGTISKTGASMLAADIGSRTVYVNLTNAAGTQSNVPAPLVVTPNPPQISYASPFTKHCAYASSTANVTLVSGPAPDTYTLSAALGGLAINAGSGQLTFDPDISEGIGPTQRVVSGTSAGGQIGSTAISVEFDYLFTVSVNSGADTALVTMRVGGGDSPPSSFSPSSFSRSSLAQSSFAASSFGSSGLVR